MSEREKERERASERNRGSQSDGESSRMSGEQECYVLKKQLTVSIWRRAAAVAARAAQH